MKPLLAAILTLTVAMSALAGQIQTPGAASSGSTTPVTTTVVLVVVNLIYG